VPEFMVNVIEGIDDESGDVFVEHGESSSEPEPRKGNCTENCD
jgi:hypothetical protein